VIISFLLLDSGGKRSGSGQPEPARAGLLNIGRYRQSLQEKFLSAKPLKL
jgi:hypothetical protein